jgi:xylose isomerase
MDKLGVDYYCFHDRDVAPDSARWPKATPLSTPSPTNSKKRRSRPARSCSGAPPASSPTPLLPGRSTSPNADVFAYAAAQVKKAMDVTHRLGGEGYTFWGGREGYATLWNTDMKREIDHLARLLHMAVDYKKKIGFKGQFYIEPKPREPSTHQYDSDAAACLNFLREHNLLEHFKLNLETNHATLAGHSMRHEMQVAIAAGALGSVDANTGDNSSAGTPTSSRRTSTSPPDHARSPPHGRPHHRRSQLRCQVPSRILRARRSLPRPHRRHGRLRPRPQDRPRDDRRRPLDTFIKQRYATFDTGIGAKIENGEVGFEELEAHILANGEPLLGSGRQEMLENLVNEYL